MWIFIWLQMMVQIVLAEPKRVVVLEFRGIGTQEVLLQRLSDQSRMAVLESLLGHGYELMTRENMMVILDDMGKDASCFEGSCEVDVARNVGADYVISGVIVFQNEQFDLTLKLHESNGGSVLWIANAFEPTVSDIKVQSYNLTLELLHKGLEVPVAPKKKTPTQIERARALDAVALRAKDAEKELLNQSNKSNKAAVAPPKAKMDDSISDDQSKKSSVAVEKAKTESKKTPPPSEYKTTPPKTVKRSQKPPPSTKQVEPEVHQPAPTTKSSVDLERGAGVPAVISGTGYRARLLPSGRFVMGCTQEQEKVCKSNEKPTHTVTLSKPFYIMDGEVNQELYQRIMGDSPSEYEGDKHPVETVSWYEAVEFANRLSAEEGLPKCYDISGDTVRWSNQSCRGWRLPTEAEWEYAARAYSDTRYAGGHSSGGVALYYDNSEEDTENTHQRPANRFGLHGMSGNVAEWVWDTMVDYSSASVTDPAPHDGTYRVYRGGGLNSKKTYLRVSARNGNRPHTRSEDVGFRLVRYP